MKNIYTLIFAFLSVSCNQATNTNESKVIQKLEVTTVDTGQNYFETLLKPNEKITLNTVYTDTVKFIEFNDDGDYALIFVEKGKDSISLIYDSEYNFIRGDEIEIRWKMDSIRYAGDNEFLEYAVFLTSAKKLKPLRLIDRRIKFLWREVQYNNELRTDINTIILNKEFISVISEPEKAVLAYVATFIGNECEWDGKANSDRSNLKCKILWELGLGYQCSYDHSDFLRFWFRNDTDIIKELKNCPTTPDGATIQDTFEEIDLTVNEHNIKDTMFRLISCFEFSVF
jgi:hypothetical protein